jgi:hypothetical protein
VVWGRLISGLWLFSVYDGQTGAPFSSLGDGYRPHINNLGHVHAAGINGIFDTSYHLVVPMLPPWLQGYGDFRRSEINNLDQLALEATRLGLQPPDLVGPRDIVLGRRRAAHHLPQPGVAGRADLNDSGVIVRQLRRSPGSTSGTGDYEIFVYDPAIGQIVQLTDDDELDGSGRRSRRAARSSGSAPAPTRARRAPLGTARSSAPCRAATPTATACPTRATTAPCEPTRTRRIPVAPNSASPTASGTPASAAMRRTTASWTARTQERAAHSRRGAGQRWRAREVLA